MSVPEDFAHVTQGRLLKTYELSAARIESEIGGNPSVSAETQRCDDGTTIPVLEVVVDIESVNDYQTKKHVIRTIVRDEEPQDDMLYTRIERRRE